jgi:S1-C subfamily serine protease
MPPEPPRRNRSSRFVAALVVGLIASIGVGIGLHDASSSSSPSAGFAPQPLTSNNGQSSSNADVNAIASRVTPAIVDITTTLSGGGEAAGTGMVISSDGLVLTNNHVIADSTSIQVDIGGSGNTHSAKVVGYDVADDVALVQIQGVSGLKTIDRGSSSTLSVGDNIVAIGNALGRGGTPAAVGGSVTALNQTITASDEGGGNAETLHGLIQVDAGIQPGDSGGPLVDTNGKVVGMDSAASSGGGRFGFDSQASSEGYAIPIERAVAIAEKIASGSGGTNIHLGSGKGLLGVEVTNGSSSGGGNGGGFGGQFNDPFGNDGSSSQSGDGASVQSVQPGSAADSAGIQGGDVITGIDGHTVSSATDLTNAMAQYNPHDKVRVDWTDSNGNARHATVELGTGPPA